MIKNFIYRKFIKPFENEIYQEAFEAVRVANIKKIKYLLMELTELEKNTWDKRRVKVIKGCLTRWFIKENNND